MSKPVQPAQNDVVAIPLDRLSKFVRQVSHDVRNGLNAIDLQATLMAELTSDPECASEAQKLRGIVAKVAQSMQQLSGYFGQLSTNFIDCPAGELIHALHDRLGREFGDKMRDVSWNADVPASAVVDIDFEQLTAALTELLKNAFEFRDGGAAIAFNAHINDGKLALEVAETKAAVPSPPAQWGAEPLISTKRGGLGLGLFHARRIIAAHRGELRQNHDNGRLVTQVLLPLKSDGH